MKKYLITGGSGFIGANLINNLLEKEAEIFLILEQGSDLWRLCDIIDKLNVFYINLLDFEKIRLLVKTIKPDIIFHLASFGGFPSQNDQKIIFDTNLYGTMNLVNACKEVGFEVFINTGSSSEYGIKNTEMSETDFLEPISDYGVAKSCSTIFCLKEAKFNNLPIYTVRPFSVYGDYEIFGRLIPTIIINSLLNLPLNLSKKDSVRDFIYIKDMVNFYINLSEKKPEKEFVFNAGTGVQSSIESVIESVEQLLNKKFEINWQSSLSRPWEPKVWKASLKRTKEVLSWAPKYDLKNGLDLTIKWFEKNIFLYQKNFLLEGKMLSK